MRTFFDSFAKRFLEESGSGRVEEICSRTEELGISVLCVPEVVSALNRRRREQVLTSVQYGQAKRRLFEDVRDADVVQLTPGVVASSVAILEAGAVRTMDALQVACAVEWKPEMFVSGDRAQLAAARRAGLIVRAV
ncbi:MAG: PIN domain-containing protein [Verrucomicrobia bacterium]|nr:PIN domain-containing protein [Verrucomicrobiota bacterium]NBR63546.1 PIN domain-containing protein [Verrucomicrobiota bacterium]